MINVDEIELTETKWLVYTIVMFTIKKSAYGLVKAGNDLPNGGTNGIKLLMREA